MFYVRSTFRTVLLASAPDFIYYFIAIAVLKLLCYFSKWFVLFLCNLCLSSSQALFGASRNSPSQLLGGRASRDNADNGREGDYL